MPCKIPDVPQTPGMAQEQEVCGERNRKPGQVQTAEEQNPSRCMEFWRNSVAQKKTQGSQGKEDESKRFFYKDVLEHGGQMGSKNPSQRSFRPADFQETALQKMCWLREL